MSEHTDNDRAAKSRQTIDSLNDAVKSLEAIYAAGKDISVIHISTDADGAANCAINGNGAELLKLFAALVHTIRNEMPMVYAMGLLLSESTVTTPTNKG